ncbi:MAG: haloacid dehalogenase-like hydrolase [Paludibacteraceae bacterium]|nr:haloacid dehalogenase-like hydrolase [Paludibacteraceae bacterium]
MPKKNIVIFDFCGTLISFQTADRYVDYCRKHLCYKSINRRYYILRLLERLRIFKIANKIWKRNNLHKKIVLYQLKGVSKTDCERMAQDYFREELLPNVIDVILQRLYEHKQQGDEIWILSGGYDIYIKYFAEYFGISRWKTSSIQFENGRCTGHISGEDCMSKAKVTYFRKICNAQENTTIFYSDSISDLPLLRTVHYGIVVSHKEHQTWAKQNNLKEIIWN